MDAETLPVDKPSTFTERSPARTRQPPKRLDDYVTNVTDEVFVHHVFRVSDVPVPVTYDEAIRSPQAQQWKNAMDEEVSSWLENDTYELTPAYSATRR